LVKAYRNEGVYLKLPTKLCTTVNKIRLFSNSENAKLVHNFYEFMKENGASERHQNNNLKAIISYSNFLGNRSLKEIDKKEDILLYLQTKIKNKEDDPEQKWITTYNDYLHRIKHFFRWLYNQHENDIGISMDLWKTPKFMESLKSKKTKRLSPYSETEIWEKDEFLSIIKYEPFKRNKAALTLLWDLDARPHEITLLKIKHIRLKERYGEGEIPFESKTGTGPILLTTSFPYVRDWLNEHPFQNELNARLICNLHNGAPIKPEALHTVMNQLKKRILRLIETDEIKDEEKEKMLSIISNKKFNPYCIRHSAITADSDYLPEYALKKKVRWSMNSKQGSRYIKTRMGNELKNKILEHNGIITEKEFIKKPSIQSCPRCDLINAFENKYCSKCSYPLNPEAFDEIKITENSKFVELEEKYDKMNNVLQNLIKGLSMVDESGKQVIAKQLIENGVFK
jgi:integrase/recombinase XerD